MTTNHATGDQLEALGAELAGTAAR